MGSRNRAGFGTADTRRLNRETNEGNEGDTGGATETMIR